MLSYHSLRLNVLNPNITVLKLNHFADVQSAVTSIEFKEIKLKIGSMYWPPLDNKFDYQRFLHMINDLLNTERGTEIRTRCRYQRPS